MTEPKRGDVWFAQLDPTQGHEQGGDRPCLILSIDAYNVGAAELVVVLPLTTKYKGYLAGLHVPVQPPEAGLTETSWILCDQIRAVDKNRLRRSTGSLAPATLDAVERLVRRLLKL